MGIFRQFPYSNFHDMNMDEIIKVVRELLDEWAQYHATWEDWKNGVDSALESFLNWFNTLDVQEEINNKIDAMAASGELAELLQPYVVPAVEAWLAAHISAGELALDNTLLVSGAAADSKVAGQNMDFNPVWTTGFNYIHYDIVNERIYTDSNISIISNHFTDTIPSGINIVKADLPNSNNIIVWNNKDHQIEFKWPTDAITRLPRYYGVIGYIQKSNFSLCSFGNLFDNVEYDNKFYINNAFNLQHSQIEMYSGDLFITACGKDIFIDSQLAKLYNKRDNTYRSVSNQRIVDAYSSSVRYLTFDPVNNNFRTSTIFSRYTVAFYTRNWVYPLIDRIHVNYRALQNAYIRSGSAFYLNVDRMGYDPKPAVRYNTNDDIKLNAHTYKFTQPEVVAYQFNPTTGSTPYFTLALNETNIQNKKVLMIGDSFVARGWLQHWINDKDPTISFIGTRTTQNYNYQCEGVSGSKITYFTDPETSPFIYNGELNFRSYLQSNNLDTPDFVVINSAINTSLYENNDYFEAMQSLIDMVHADYPNIKVYVTYGANYAMNIGSVYGYPNRRFWEVRIACNSVYALTDCVIIPIDYILDDDIDYVHETITDMGAEIDLLTDCVHPSENTGFRKMGYMIYNYLGI